MSSSKLKCHKDCICYNKGIFEELKYEDRDCRWYKPDGNKEISPSDVIIAPNFFKAARIPWLTIPSSVKYHKKQEWEEGALRIIRSVENTSRIIKFLEISIPPILGSKFHSVNIMKLMQKDKTCTHNACGHYQEVAAWFVMWNESFGLHFLHDLRNKHKVIDKLNKNPEVVFQQHEGTKFENAVTSWQTEMDAILLLMGQATNIICSPISQDLANGPEECLLEPCVIMQLPWQPVMFHQWLCVAMVEILQFEIESLELRHWPMHPSIESSARELLFLIKQLKDRVLLGLTIFLKQIIAYPKVNQNHPKWILDEVLLPSLATLKYLTSGQAYITLNNIKKIAFSKNVFENTISGIKLRLDYLVYDADYDLYNVYGFMYFHPNYWSFIQLLSPFAERFCLDINVETIIKKLNNATIPPPTKLLCAKTNNREELAFWISVGTDQDKPWEFLSNEKRVDLTLSTIKDQIIDTGIFPEPLWQPIQKVVEIDGMVKMVGAELFQDTENIKNHTKLQCMYAMLYHDMNKKLIGSEVDRSIIATIVNIGHELMKREQVIKLANLLCVRLCVTPVAPNINIKKSMNITEINQTIQKVKQERKNNTRDWFWKQFPQAWQNPVNMEEPPFIKDVEFVDLIQSGRDRVGRIILNAAKECFGIYEKGGEVYPHWQVVQYIVPSYLAKYENHIKSRDHTYPKPTNKDFDLPGTVRANYLTLMHGILQHYENSYNVWSTKLTPRKDVAIIKKPNDDPNQLARELFETTQYYIEISHWLLAAHLGPNCQSIKGTYNFEHVKRGVTCWPVQLLNAARTVTHVNVPMQLWLLKALSIFKDLYDIFIKSWNFPLKANLAIHPQLEEMYKCNLITFTLVSTAKKHHIIKDTPQNKKILMEFKSIEKRMSEEGERLKMQLPIVNINYCPDPKNSVPYLIYTSQELLTTSYRNLKQLKECIGIQTIQTYDHLPNFPPELKQAVAFFLNNNFSQLDKILKFIVKPGEAQKKKKAIKNKKIEQLFPAAKPSSEAFQKCRNCPKTERKWGPFMACEECIAQKYPDVNFFCSVKCKTEWWAQEHLAEHLEYDLGLSEFNTSK